MNIFNVYTTHDPVYCFSISHSTCHHFGKSILAFTAGSSGVSVLRPPTWYSGMAILLTLAGSKKRSIVVECFL